MKRLLSCSIALFAVGAVSAGGAVKQVPSLRAAAGSRGHISVTLAVGDLVPGLIVVGTGVKAGSPGDLLIADAALRERIVGQADPITGLVVWRTRKALKAGVYRVQVSGFLTDGVTSCFPRGTDCTQRWSNVRRVVLR